MRLLVLSCLLLLLLGTAFADLSVPLNDNITIFATVTNGQQPANATSVGIAVYWPNGSQWLADPMVSDGNGTYYYELQTNTLGRHQVMLSIAIGSTNYTRTSFFDVTENTNMSIAIIIGFIFLISALAWLSKDFFSKPDITLPSLRTASKWLDMKVWGVFVMLAAMWGLVLLLYFMRLQAEGTTSAPMLETLYFVGVLLMGAFSIVYTAFFFIFQYAESIEKFRNVK
jgi:hypothetical protein